MNLHIGMPRDGHLSSFFLPGVGHCHAFSAWPWGIVHLKKKKVQMPGGVPGGGGGRGMGNARID